MSLWVCSKWNETPTDAEKLEVVGAEYNEGARACWIVYADSTHSGHLYLPKSHYVPCPPPAQPERWIDVTSECEVASSGITLVHAKCRVVSGGVEGYRLRKVLTQMEGRAGTAWAFIVEKKVTS